MDDGVRRLSRSRVVLEADALAHCLCATPAEAARSSNGQLALLLLLARLQELSIWINSAQLSRLFTALDTYQGVEPKIRRERLRKAMEVLHICLSGEADLRAVLDKEGCFEERLVMQGAQRHKAAAIIVADDSPTARAADRSQVPVMTAQEYLHLIEREEGITYSITTLPHISPSP